MPAKPSCLPRLAPLGLALLPAGCATQEAFREPQDAPSAKLRIRNAQPEAFYINVRAADPTTCSVGPLVGRLNGGKEIDNRRVGMLDSEPVKEGLLERRIAAGTPITFVPQVIANLDWVTIMTIRGEAMESSRERARNAQAGVCSTPSFVPVAGEEYELVYHPAPGSCTVTLEKLTVGNDGKTKRLAISNRMSRRIEAVPGSHFGGIPKVTCQD